MVGGGLWLRICLVLDLIWRGRVQSTSKAADHDGPHFMERVPRYTYSRPP